MTPAIGLSGRKALVTGSATGIGQAIAEAFAEAGAAVVAHGLQGASDAARAWSQRGFSVAESHADLGDPNGVARLAADISPWGSPDILVLNASIEILQDWRSVDAAAFDMQCRVNVEATLRLIQTFVPPMLSRGWGRVIAIGSTQEARPNSRHFIYSATKAAQTSMILNLARHTAIGGVTFNVVKPGAIETNRNSARLEEAGLRQKVIESIPLGRIGAPKDCVGAVLLLCSEAGGYINGAEIPVDGGQRL